LGRPVAFFFPFLFDFKFLARELRPDFLPLPDFDLVLFFLVTFSESGAVLSSAGETVEMAGVTSSETLRDLLASLEDEERRVNL
jgi:hypothetical protein